MAPIRPRVCAGWSEPLLVAYTTLLEDRFTMLLVHVRTNNKIGICNRLITTDITTLIASVGIKSGTAAQGTGSNIGSKICMYQAEFKYCPFPY